MRPILTSIFCPYYVVQQRNWLKHIHCFASLPLTIKTCQFRSISKADVTILGFRIPSVGFLVVKDPSTVLEPQYSTQMPGVIGCNLIRLGCEEFGKVFGFKAFKTFTCPKEVHPLIFAQMCTLYHQGKVQVQSVSHTSNNSQSNSTQSNSVHITTSQVNFHSTQEDLSPLDTILSQVWVGSLYHGIFASQLIQ